MAFLEGLNAPDLGLFINGEDFAAYQSMTEEMRQEVTYTGAFGSEGPVLRHIRAADEGTISFSAVLLKKGVARGLNSEKVLSQMRDFQIITRRGDSDEGRTVYNDCNWTRISINSTMGSVTLDCDMTVPGYPGPVAGVPTA